MQLEDLGSRFVTSLSSAAGSEWLVVYDTAESVTNPVKRISVANLLSRTVTGAETSSDREVALFSGISGDVLASSNGDLLVTEDGHVKIPNMASAADDTAAAAAGVPVGGLYHNSGTVQIRLV